MVVKSGRAGALLGTSLCVCILAISKKNRWTRTLALEAAPHNDQGKELLQ